MLGPSSLEQLAKSLRGRLITSTSPDFETERKAWNGIVDQRPLAIAYCEGTADVITALDFSRTHHLPTAVRGGGHSVSGKAVADGALTIDLSPLRSVHVDPAARTARVDGGATWGAVDHETQAFGLAVTGGIDSRTGVAGLTLGGGVGFLARAYGLTIDHLKSVDVVLADGRLLTASETENPDMFWALRGGGGNFGVVTSFEFRLNEVGPEVITAQVFHTMDSAADAVAFYRDFMAEASDKTSCYAVFINMPPVASFDEGLQGSTTLAFSACHAGPLDEGEAALAPLAAFGSPILSVVAPMPYTALQSGFEEATPDGARYYWKAQYMDELTDEAITLLVTEVDPLPGPYSTVSIDPMGGAIATVGATATAFPHRVARFGLRISAGWTDPDHDDAATTWARSLHQIMGPHTASDVYSNYLDHDDADRVEAAYGVNLARLQEIKAKYDPNNVFNQANLNVVPAS